MRNPTHFEIISSRRFFDHDQAAAVSRDNAELIELTERTLADAFAAGQLRPVDLKQVQIAGRALVYGFARMNIDGHFPRWGVAAPRPSRPPRRSSISLSRGSPGGRDAPGMTAPDLPCTSIACGANSLRVHDDYTTFL